MRSYKLTLAALFVLAPAVLGLAACTQAEPETPEAQGAGQPEAQAAPARPQGEPVTPAADLSAASALEASTDAAPAAEGGAPLPDPFPGEADLAPSLKAVSDFCARPGSLAFMTGDGCRAALPQLARSVTSSQYFETMDDCLVFLRQVRAERYKLAAEHKEWCRRAFVNLHDRKGCYDAAPVFLDSLNEQGFCRKAPEPEQAPKKSLKPAPRPAAKNAQAPYISGYREPGQKFDSPKSRPAGSVKAKAATAVKGAAKSAAQPKAAPASAPAAVAPASATPAAASSPASAPSVTAPAASTPLAVPPSAPDAPVAAPPPAAASAPAAPPSSAGPSRPAETRLEEADAQSINAITGPNAVSPGAVPAGVLATSGGQVEATSLLPEQGPRPANLPVLPAPGAAEPAPLAEPVIGPREAVTPLPPVPVIGRIAPTLVPGVPPDTAVMDNTLPAPDDSPLPPPGTATAGQVHDAFGEIIPNVMPPPPPDPRAASPDALPLSGAPAGQSGQ